MLTILATLILSFIVLPVTATPRVNSSTISGPVLSAPIVSNISELPSTNISSIELPNNASLIELPGNMTTSSFLEDSGYHINPATGVPDFITFGPTGLKIPESDTGDPAQVALGFFENFPLVFGTGDVPNQLHVVSIQRDESLLNMAHVVLQQIYGGIPVFGAELRVHIKADMSISSIGGNYLRDPQVLLEPGISEEIAKDTAVFNIANIRAKVFNETSTTTVPFPGLRHPSPGLAPPSPDALELGISGFDRLFNRIIQEVRNEVQSKGLVIFPGKLSQVPNATNDLAYQFQFPEADVFVSAMTKEIIFVIPNFQPADRLVYDALGKGELSFPELILRNGQRVSITEPNSEVPLSETLIRETLGFYSKLGRTSYDNRNSAASLVTNSKFSFFVSCPNAFWDSIRNQMWFCNGQVEDDIVGHEFTHGVTQYTANLIYVDEPGALNEHYSDVMGALAFPDAPGQWIIGDNTVRRNMTTSTPNNYANYLLRGPGCTGVLDILTTTCDMGNVHRNSAIGNRAATLLSDGSGITESTHKGIGQDRLALLFHNTLTTRMHPWSTYIDERFNTWQTAMDLAASGVTVTDTQEVGGRLNFTGVANEVSWAFTRVGVDPRLISGWFEIPGGLTGGTGTTTFYAGQTLPPGSIVGDVELVVQAITPVDTPLYPAGTPYWEGRVQVSTGGSTPTVTFPGGIFGASIISHGVGTANKQVDIRFFHSGFLPLKINVNIVPVGVPAPSPPVGSPPSPMPPIILPDITEHPSPGGVHWSDLALGGKGDDTINPDNSLTGDGCVITDVILRLLDGDGDIVATTSLGSPAAVKHYGFLGALSYGAEITSANINTANEAVTVHWWFDIGSAVRYDLLYSLTGTNCGL